MNETICRCGWTEGSPKPHPCHRCRRQPGSERFWHEPGPIRYAIAGVQPKLVVHDTVACDSCWEAFQKVHKAVAAGDPVPTEWNGTMTSEQVFGPKKD